MLTEMGFTDTPAAVRLLRHLGVPASLSSADSHVSPEGLTSRDDIAAVRGRGPESQMVLSSALRYTSLSSCTH